MWLFTKVGFFSVVQHRDHDDTLLVRARDADDLKALKKRYMPTLGAIQQKDAADYPYRAAIGRNDFAAGMEHIALDIDYMNFKRLIARNDPMRARAYTAVWAVMLSINR